MDNLTIPNFLLIPQDQRRESWRGRKLTKPKMSVKVTRDEDPSTRAFRRTMEKKEAEAKKLKYQLLRERYGKR